MHKGYRVVRMYANRPGYRRTIVERCTENEAHLHCTDPETSSRTCTTAAGKRRTKTHGPWFDAYEAR